MLSNLTLWLLYHYDGTFMVVVDAKTIYKKVQGQSKNEIELRVKSKCGTDGACQEGKNNFRMTENIAGSFKDFFSSTSKPTPSAGCEPSGRKELYSWKDWKVPGLNAINSHIRKVAWNLTWWLCGLRVEPSRSPSNGIAYQINLRQRGADERPTSLETLLRRSPKMLQLEWTARPSPGSMPETAVEIYDPAAFADARESLDRDSALAKEAREALIRRCYPGLNDLFDAAESKCKCLNCTLGADLPAAKQLKSGCLKFYA
jgi:hypothetical protein